jgi:hypothetical protein
MDQFAVQFPTGAPLSLVNLLINLAIGIPLSLLLRWHFERFGSTLSSRGEFAQVFPFIVLTTLHRRPPPLRAPQAREDEALPVRRLRRRGWGAGSHRFPQRGHLATRPGE